jgi:hypothetical protein
MEPDLALTLAGGGNRAFYQTGLLRRWGSKLLPRLRAVATSSAGASVALLFFSERGDQTGTFWKGRCSGITRNLDFRRLLRGERLAPHGVIYRETMVYAMQEGGLETIQALPFPILVVTSSLPAWATPTLATVVGLTAYSVEKRLRPERLHPTFGRRLGFEPRVYDARACRTPEEIADLVLASSATPPFTPVGRMEGKPVLDGGLVDNVPAFGAEAVEGVKKNLVLLTRPYPSAALGRRGTRLYIAPSCATPISRWDYTRPALLDETIAMGERESALHEPLLDDFLAS